MKYFALSHLKGSTKAGEAIAHFLKTHYHHKIVEGLEDSQRQIETAIQVILSEQKFARGKQRVWSVELDKNFHHGRLYIVRFYSRNEDNQMRKEEGWMSFHEVMNSEEFEKVRPVEIRIVKRGLFEFQDAKTKDYVFSHLDEQVMRLQKQMRDYLKEQPNAKFVVSPLPSEAETGTEIFIGVEKHYLYPCKLNELLHILRLFLEDIEKWQTSSSASFPFAIFSIAIEVEKVLDAWNKYFPNVFEFLCSLDNSQLKIILTSYMINSLNRE